MPAPPEPKSWWNADFRRRLGYYCFGVTIGLFALGFFTSMRAKAARQQAASAEAAAANTPSFKPTAAPTSTPTSTPAR